MALGSDTLMGAVLIIAALLVAAYLTRGEQAARAGAAVGTVATLVIGLVLLFSNV